MSREDQKRVEVRPGVFLWLNAADEARLLSSSEEPELITSAKAEPETTSVKPAETAARPAQKKR